MWAQYVRAVLKPAVPELGSDAVRTVLDLGAGSGGLLARLQTDYPGTVGVGITRDSSRSPFLETMAARGVVGLQVSLTDRLPFIDGAFDMLHSRLSGLRFAMATSGRGAGGGGGGGGGGGVRAVLAGGGGGARHAPDWAKLDAAVYEWDRVCRPGGFIVQTGWKLHGGQRTWNATASRMLALARRLGWRERFFARHANAIEFAFQKPLERRNDLPPLSEAELFAASGRPVPVEVSAGAGAGGAATAGGSQARRQLREAPPKEQRPRRAVDAPSEELAGLVDVIGFNQLAVLGLVLPWLTAMGGLAYGYRLGMRHAVPPATRVQR